ncbi:hypothetical protein [Streptomyces griseorubiginosus]|uniref:hypothetical protein n=1 Tax=Streptomyces griseorubiginosus TaxID=67304 RepID=UPI001AD7BA26|nr:hypothetical protein [Streptomyces griseorubiginosus]MBO4257284.1 hypothetical protein [Streptomyces griseorubiginosus]
MARPAPAGDLLRRAVRRLAPGGWIPAEDFCFLPGEDAPTLAGPAVVQAYLRAFSQHRTDMRFVRRLPSGCRVHHGAGTEARDVTALLFSAWGRRPEA